MKLSEKQRTFLRAAAAPDGADTWAYHEHGCSQAVVWELKRAGLVRALRSPAHGVRFLLTDAGREALEGVSS